MSTPALPSYEQVLALPELHTGEVRPEFIDVNGHMNIRHYLDAGALGADVLCRQIGIDDAYRAERRLGIFTAEHHIRYFAEMHEGDRFSVRTVLVERSAKVGHLLSFVLDVSAEVLACTVEIIVVGVDMDTRRPADFADAIAGALDEHVEQTSRLDWQLPLSGAMGVRRR